MIFYFIYFSQLKPKKRYHCFMIYLFHYTLQSVVHRIMLELLLKSQMEQKVFVEFRYAENVIVLFHQHMYKNFNTYVYRYKLNQSPKCIRLRET